MAPKIAIINLGIGNVNSVRKAMSMINTESIITSSSYEIKSIDKLILPGIGHFQKAMEALKKYQLWETLNELVLIKKKPILGICLGMHVMSGSSEEGNIKGMGWLDAEVVKFQNKLGHLKIPHMGWNMITKKKESLLMKSIPDHSEFYFAHSYHWKTENAEHVISETKYGNWFPSAIEKENIFGVQFHPEKSHDAGIQLLQNFSDL